MDNLLKIRGKIYDHFHSSAMRGDYFLKPENSDRLAQYDVAMYLLQDTGEAIWTHMRLGFSQNSMLAYIEFWGVMQAVVIQQDALFELHEAVTGSKGAPRGNASKAIRELRNVCVGHPSKKMHGQPAPLRAFMGRQSKSYAHIDYELWDASSKKVSHPSFNLGAMIEAYDLEAAAQLNVTLEYMRDKWPA